jgi:capsular polysaccharide transport system permease protein
MSVHGVIRPDGFAELEGSGGIRGKIGPLFRAYRYFLLLVVFPTLLVAAYYYLMASDQYESGADFVVRRSETASTGTGGMGQLLGFNFGTSSTASEAYIVEEYLLSHNAVRRLRDEDQLVERFRRPGTDWISRLWYSDPNPENLLSYYKGQVTIRQDSETGITHLRVHAFRPDDAYHLSRKLLLLGEERINSLNTRTFNDQVATARRELGQAEEALFKAQRKLTGFRRLREDIDPEGSGKAQIGLVANLTGDLVAVRARLRAMEGVISRNSPQYQALSSQLRALEGQVAGQSSRIAGQEKSIATTLGDYEDLVIRREHAAKRYSAAAAQYEQAKAEASRKQLYLIRVVDANLPVKSLFPERGKIVLTVFFSLLIAYAVGWLLMAGVKEHHL